MSNSVANEVEVIERVEPGWGDVGVNLDVGLERECRHMPHKWPISAGLTRREKVQKTAASLFNLDYHVQSKQTGQHWQPPLFPSTHPRYTWRS
jgi:hypothetical protein